MTRLAATAVAQYFRTPDVVTERICRSLQSSEPGVRVLDPCAGTGLAVEQVAQALNGKAWAIELSEERAVECEQRFGTERVIRGTALSTKLSSKGWGCLFLNPPYEFDSAAGTRLEQVFLRTATPWLMEDGVLVFIVPRASLHRSAEYIGSHYERVVVYEFPQPELGDFDQIVLFATRKGVVNRDLDATERLFDIAHRRVAVEALPEQPIAYTVPASHGRPPTFKTLEFDLAAALSDSLRYGAWPVLNDWLYPLEVKRRMPLMPLRRGHLAMLSASGFFDNIVLTDSDGRRVLVKGQTRKEMVVVEDTKEKRVERERVITVLTTLDLQTGKVETVETGSVKELVTDAEEEAA